MPDASASDTAMQFADYVLESYIAVDSKFPPVSCGLSRLTCYSVIQAMALSLLTGIWLDLSAEFYVKHPNIYVFVDVLQWKDSAISVGPMFLRIACHSRHGSLNTTERRQSLWCLPIRPTIIAHSLLQERSFWRKFLIVMVREPKCDNARSINFIQFGLFLWVFVQFLHAFYTLLSCVFIYGRPMS